MIIHGQSNTVYTGWQRAIATAIAANEPAGTNILAVDWSDWADATVPTNVFPHTANVARRVARGLFGPGITDHDGFEILGLKLDPRNTHLIGHSFGAHISGMIGGYVSGRLSYRDAYLTGINPYRGMVKRITALDAAEEGVQHSYIVTDGAVPQLFDQYAYEPPEPWDNLGDILDPEPHPNHWGLGWGNFYGSKVATFLDSYKSSSFDGGETAWGDENFLLVQDGTHWNQDDRDGGIFDHAAHGYAYQWYASTIGNAGTVGNPYGLGYWWNTQSDYTWAKVTEKLQSPVTTGPWRGLIRGTSTTSELEGISVTITDPNNSDPKLKYPGTWAANPNPARNGIQALNDSAAVNRVLDDLARVVELSISTETLTAVSPLPVGSSQPIQFTIADQADVRSLADSDRHEKQSRHNFAYKAYLSTKETVDADAILLNTEGFLPVVKEAQDQRLINTQLALPTKAMLQSKYGTDVGSSFFIIVQVAKDYSYELYKDNNTKAFPVTLDLEAQAVKIDAGPDQWIEDPIYVGLNGSNSGPLTAIDTSTIRWSSPSSDVYIFPTNNLSTGASIENARRSGQYEFVLEFKDLQGTSYRDTMIVHVREPNPEPPKDPEGNANTQPIAASDPNQLIGPAGYGPENFVALKALDYRIDFENDPEATAPAQVVTIVNELSSHFDLDTFQIREIGWGTTRLPMQAQTRQLDIAVPVTIGGQSFDVRIQTELNYATRTFQIELQSVDPLTSLPPDIFTGFLPPEDGAGTGQGFVSYSIAPKADTPTGTEIRNIASITFDYGETIFTNQVDPHDPTQGTDPAKEALVTIDAEAPVATVSPLWPVTTLTTFPIYWDGEDLVGAGFASYVVYVAEENGPFALWLSETTATHATFTGIAGKTYHFRVLGRDLVGNLQTLDSATQTKVTIANTPTPVADAFAYKPGKVLAGNVIKNDVNPTKRKLTAVLVSPPTAGGVELQPSGAFRYTPNAGSAARDSFIYKLRDQDGNESGPMTVTLATQLVNFRKVAVKGAEKTGTVTLTVDLLTPAVLPTTVTSLVAPQNARGRGRDYTANSGTLTFVGGERTKTITITIHADNFDEENETLQVWLQDISGNAALGNKPMATVSLTDANASPLVAFRTSATVGSEEISQSVEVFLSEPSERMVTVNYNVLKSSKAKFGSDHQLAKGTLTFAPGVTSLLLPVPIIDDLMDEPNESLTLGLSAPKNAVLKGNKTHTYTVHDNDVPPTVAFTTATQTVNETDGTVYLTVRLSAPSAFPVSVRYGLDLTRSATSGQDFRLVAGKLKFAAGETEKQIALKLTNDTLAEATETIIVFLYEPVGVTLGTMNLVTVSILDEE